MASKIIFLLLACFCWATTIGNAQATCVEKLDQTMKCVQEIRTSGDSQNLEKQKDEILQKCAPSLPAHCKAIKTATEQCQQKVSADQDLQKLQTQVKQNVAKCFEQFSGGGANASAGSGGAPPPPPGPGGFGSGAPPDHMMLGNPAGPPPGDDPQNQQNPCVLNHRQMRCIKTAMRQNSDAREIAGRLEDKEKDCYTEAINSHCMIDGSNGQLRDCVGSAEEPFVQQSAAKMQQCMQATLPNNATNAAIA